MSWLTYVKAQFLLSQRVFWRQLGFALSGVLVPLGLGIALPLFLRGRQSTAGVDDGLFALTGFIGFTLLWIVYSLINSTTSRRDQLTYKRLRGTELPDSSIFVGEALSGSVVSLCQVVVLAVAGAVLFHTSGPRNVALFAVVTALSTLMFALLAIGLSGLLPSAEVSTWIATPFIVLMMFGSGVYLPITTLPPALRPVAEALPLTPVVRTVRTAYLGRDYVHGGTQPRRLDWWQGFHECATSIGLICVWLVLGLWLAKRFFRWNPRRHG
jgi:ABC-2 type transport system permease protein